MAKVETPRSIPTLEDSQKEALDLTKKLAEDIPALIKENQGLEGKVFTNFKWIKGSYEEGRDFWPREIQEEMDKLIPEVTRLLVEYKAMYEGVESLDFGKLQAEVSISSEASAYLRNEGIVLSAVPIRRTEYCLSIRNVDATSFSEDGTFMSDFSLDGLHKVDISVTKEGLEIKSLEDSGNPMKLHDFIERKIVIIGQKVLKMKTRPVNENEYKKRMGIPEHMMLR